MHRAQDYADKFGCEFHAGEKPWGLKVDMVMPAATQNDIRLEDAKKIVAAGTKYIVEVANMPCTNEAIEYFAEVWLRRLPVQGCQRRRRCHLRSGDEPELCSPRLER